MYKLQQLFPVLAFILILTLILFFPTATANCTPSEEYTTLSVSHVNGWLLITVGHIGWTCEVIAGELTSKPDLPDSSRDYFILTDGRKAYLLGGYNSLLVDNPPVGFLNGKLHVIQQSRRKESFKKVTLTVNGEPRNFTLIRSVTIAKEYSFNGDCFVETANCTTIKYPNGTVERACKGRVNTPLLKPPLGKERGIPAVIEGGELRFALDGKDYRVKLPGRFNSSLLNLTVFKAKGGLVLVNWKQMMLPPGTGIDEVSLLFTVRNGSLFKLGVKQNFSELTCNRTMASPGNEKGICGPGFMLLVSLIIRASVRKIWR